MEVNIVKNSTTELVITQQRKFTITGSFFCLPVILLLFNWPSLSLLSFFGCIVIAWMSVLLFFYRGMHYTFIANKQEKTLEVRVRSIFSKKTFKFQYADIHHVIMAETDRIFHRTENWNYHIIIEASNNRRINFFGFTNRKYCKQTAALIESYL